MGVVVSLVVLGVVVVVVVVCVVLVVVVEVVEAVVVLDTLVGLSNPEFCFRHSISILSIFSYKSFSICSRAVLRLEEMTSRRVLGALYPSHSDRRIL